MRHFLTLIIVTIGSVGLFANGVSETNSERVELSGINTLDISIDSGDIKIVTGDRDDISLELVTYKDGPKLFIERGIQQRLK